jgi:hypothetical protein
VTVEFDNGWDLSFSDNIVYQSSTFKSYGVTNNTALGYKADGVTSKRFINGIYNNDYVNPYETTFYNQRVNYQETNDNVYIEFRDRINQTTYAYENTIRLYDQELLAGDVTGIVDLLLLVKDAGSRFFWTSKEQVRNDIGNVSTRSTSAGDLKQDIYNPDTSDFIDGGVHSLARVSGVYVDGIEVSSVPLPGSVLFMLTGIVGLVVRRRVK